MPGWVQELVSLLEGKSRRNRPSWSSRHGRTGGEPETRTHKVHDWVFVLEGRLRQILGDREIVLDPGEVAEFDTHVPHWMGLADSRPVELLALFGSQGEHAHPQAHTT